MKSSHKLLATEPKLVHLFSESLVEAETLQSSQLLSLSVFLLMTSDFAVSSLEQTDFSSSQFSVQNAQAFLNKNLNLHS